MGACGEQIQARGKMDVERIIDQAIKAFGIQVVIELE